MSTLEQIIKQQQKLNRLESQAAIDKVKARKQETRRKIELGGLVVKAKMDGFSKAIILGALVDAFDNLQQDEAYRSLFKAKGEAAFLGYRDESYEQEKTDKS